MIVVDTNILAYLLIDGERTDACRRVLGLDAEWCAPFLWRSEFRNVLTTHMRYAEMKLTGAKERMQMASNLISSREFSISSDNVLSFTKTHTVSAYDAEFLCLAAKLSTKLVTTDKKILAECPEIAINPEEFVSNQTLSAEN